MDTIADASETTTHTITVCTDGERQDVEVERGLTLRQALRNHDLSPHSALTDVANCGGHGHCGLCTVEVLEGAPPPTQTLDRALDGMGMGRLSCLVTVEGDMTVRLN